MPLEKYISAATFTIPCHTRFENASSEEILHQAKDHPVAAARRHNVNSDWEDFLMQRDVGKVGSGAN